MGKVFNITGGGGGSGIKLASIAVITYPTKTTYTAGETFDPSGMVIEATYSNGAKLEATGYSFTPSTPLTDGTEAVTIRYTEGGVTKTVDVPITVIHRLTGLRVTTQPSKRVYEYGESFDPAGMVVTAEYSDGYTEAVTGYTYSPTGAFSSLGQQTITVTYTDGKETVTATLAVTVERQTIGAVPTQSGTLTYNGSAQSPVWTGYDSEKMTLGGVTSGTDAGSYSAEFTPTANYRWADGTTTAKTVAWSISRAVISSIPTQSGTVTYNGAEQGPAWSGYDADKLTIGGTVTGINAGSYTATFTPKANYEWSDGTQSAKNATWTIGKAAGSVSVSPILMQLTTAEPSKDATLTIVGDGAVSVSSSNTSIVTAKLLSSGTTVRATAVANGDATITITLAEGANYLGDWTDFDVNVSFFNDIFANNSWGDIIAACQSGSVPQSWAVGDRKTMQLADQLMGTQYEVEIDIIGKNHDDYADGSGKAPLTFQLHDCDDYLSTSMNNTATNAGSWRDCTMRTSTLARTLTLLPSEVQTGIREVNKLTSAGNQSGTIITTADKLFLLSEVEIFGSVTYSGSGEGSQYAYYSAGNSTVKNRDGAAVYWWERSPRLANSTSFCIVSTSGAAGSASGNASRGVAFAFCF